MGIPFVSDTQATLGSRLRGNDGFLMTHAAELASSTAPCKGEPNFACVSLANWIPAFAGMTAHHLFDPAFAGMTAHHLFDTAFAGLTAHHVPD
jgi:hypothetical protein